MIRPHPGSATEKVQKFMANNVIKEERQFKEKSSITD
jgi:hypothetical protein